METTSQPSIPPPGSLVLTACKGHLLLEPDTPNAVYRGRRIYFCLPGCLSSFVQDPKTSCLAGDPLQEGE